MPSHAQVAASVRRNKERNPEAYCAHFNCLWRIRRFTTKGKEAEIKPCPKHG